MTIVLDGTTGVNFPAGGSGNPTSTVVGVTDTQSLYNKSFGSGFQIIPAPLTTTPITTAFEYDGRLPYFTPQGTQRGIMPAAQYYRLNTANAGANVSTTQSVFGVGATLSASTIYAFEGFYMLIKGTGTTGHNIGYGFGGTATVNNAAFAGVASLNGSSSAPINTNVFSGFTQSLASTAYTTSLTSSGVWTSIRFWGTVSVNAGGTFIPQYTLSAAPGGAYTVQIGSYINIYPVGASGANTSVGTWA
jgi:hypothetical protein